MTLTLDELEIQLRSLRLHRMTDTNVLGVQVEGGCVMVESGAGLRAELSDAQSDLKTVSTELEEVQKERDELERRVNELETVAENSPEDLAHALSVKTLAEETFRQRASDWAKEVEAMRAEVAAMRKRKGVAAGVCAYSHEVWTLLAYVSQSDGRYCEDARKLCGKINLLG